VCITAEGDSFAGSFLAALLAVVHYPLILRCNPIDSSDFGSFSWRAVISRASRWHQPFYLGLIALGDIIF
jgi:hypothetical protein